MMKAIRLYQTSLVLKLDSSSGLDKSEERPRDGMSPLVEELSTILGSQKQYMPTPPDEDHNSTPTALLERVATSIRAIAAP